MDSVREQVLASVGAMTAVEVANIRMKDRLCEDLGLDRVAKLELISTIAEELQLDVELLEAKKIVDVQGLIDFAGLRLPGRSE